MRSGSGFPLKEEDDEDVRRLAALLDGTDDAGDPSSSVVSFAVLSRSVIEALDTWWWAFVGVVGAVVAVVLRCVDDDDDGEVGGVRLMDVHKYAPAFVLGWTYVAYRFFLWCWQK